MGQRIIFSDGDGMQIVEEFRNVSALLCSSPEKFLTREQMNPREIFDGHLKASGARSSIIWTGSD